MGYKPFLVSPPPAESERKPIYWTLSEVAKRLGPTYTRPSQKAARSMSGSNTRTQKFKARKPGNAGLQREETNRDFQEKCPRSTIMPPRLAKTLPLTH